MAPNAGPEEWMICGKSCLAGDIFGEFRFDKPLKPGDRLSIQDAAGYTMVKKNWFNGVKMPAIAIRELDGTVRLQRDFGYDEFVARCPDPVSSSSLSGRHTQAIRVSDARQTGAGPNSEPKGGAWVT
jgi:hypothetical protein